MSDQSVNDYRGAVSDLAFRSTRAQTKEVEDAIVGVPQERSFQAAPLHFIDPKTVVSINSSSRTPISWTTYFDNEIVPRGATAAYVLFKYRDSGDAGHSANIKVRQTGSSMERVLVETSFDYDDEDKDGSVAFFVPVDEWGRFDYASDGGYRTITIEIHGYIM